MFTTEAQPVTTTSSKVKKPLLEGGMTLLSKAICPYCDYQFDKPLSRKKNCPQCKQDIYVRTLPNQDEKDKIRVAVTEEQAEKIEEAWAKLNGTYDEYRENKERYEKMKNDLRHSWGKEPSESDIQWHLLMENRVKYAQEHQWGLFRNATLGMAEHLYSEKDYELSLRHYLGVLYLDLNGPNNVGYVNGKPYLDGRTKEFDPKDSFMAPGIMKRIILLKDKRIPMDNESVKNLFLDEAGQIYASIQPPLSPEQAWKKFEKTDEFWGN